VDFLKFWNHLPGVIEHELKIFLHAQLNDAGRGLGLDCD
jgi:hypothetical protein